jgi:hypothetical protein
MNGTEQRQMRPVADLVITALMLAIFGWALWTALGWTFRAALFPLMVTITGLGLAVLHLVKLLAWPAASATAKPTGSESWALESDDEVEAHELEYEFAHASRRTWLVNIGWVVAFFGAVFVVGLFLTSPAFSLIYLRFGAGRSWRFAVTYAAIVGAVLFGLFDQMLGLQMPLGIAQS